MFLKYDEDARFQEQVGLLIRALRSDLASVKEVAVVQLSLFGPKAIPYLTSALSRAFVETSSSRYERSNPEEAINGIVRVLGIIGDSVPISDIANALPRPEAVEALAKIGNNKALEAVIAGMPKWYDEYDEYVKLREYGSAGCELEPIDDFVRKIFGCFGEEGKKGLQTALHEGNKETKDTVAKILAALGEPDLIPALLEALENVNFSTKAEAARALHKLKAREAVPKMVTELLKTQDYVHSSSRKAENKWQDAYRALAEAVLELGSVDDWMLISFHRPKVPKVDYYGYGYGKPNFNAAIIKSGERAVPGLTKLLQASDPDIQRDAAEMIAKIKRGKKKNPSPFY
jgi:HEAT repeat protein